MGCIAWGAQRGVHNVGCTPWGAQRGMHSVGCTMWGAQCGVPDNVGCTVWSAQRGVHNVGCTTWGTQRGVHSVGCTTWGAQRGVHNVGCTMWGAKFGVFNVGCTMRGAHCGGWVRRVGFFQGSSRRPQLRRSWNAGWILRYPCLVARYARLWEPLASGADRGWVCEHVVCVGDESARVELLEGGLAFDHLKAPNCKKTKGPSERDTGPSRLRICCGRVSRRHSEHASCVPACQRCHFGAHRLHV